MPDPPTNLCVFAEPYMRTDDVRALERAVEEAGVTVAITIVNEPENPGIKPNAEANAINNPIGIDTIRILFAALDRYRAWTLVFAEKKITEELGLQTPTMGRMHVKDIPCLSNSDIYYVSPIMDGNWAEFSPDTIDMVRERCDVAIRFGFGLIKGDILHAPQFGVLSFHPADVREYRGLGVPQAWLDDRDTMGITLQLLNEEIDGGEIVAYAERNVSGCATLWDAFNDVNGLKEELLARGIENLRDPSFETTVPDSLGPYYSIKKRRRISFASRTLFKNMVGRFNRRT